MGSDPRDRRLVRRLVVAGLVALTLLLASASWLSGGPAYRAWVGLAYGECEEFYFSGSAVSHSGQRKRARWLPGPEILWADERRDRDASDGARWGRHRSLSNRPVWSEEPPSAFAAPPRAALP